jgi:4-hydroxybenzoate polyprenyltransferase
MKFVYLTGALGIVICLMLNLTVFIIGATYYVLVFLYSYPGVRFKNRFILKNLVTSLLTPTAYLISGVAIENEISRTMAFVAFTYFSLTVLIQPAIADMLDYKEDKAFNVKTIGNVLSWKQNLILFNSGLVMLMASSILSFTVFGFNYIVPTITPILCTYLIIYSYKIRNENGESASYKLRPITYTILCLSPLLMAIGAFL